MNVILLFLAAMLLTGARAARRGRVNRAWPVFVTACLVTATFLSQRAY